MVRMGIVLLCAAHLSMATDARNFPHLIRDSLPVIMTREGSPYLLQGAVKVPAKSICTIEPGTVILFGPFATLNVHGTLRARGTSRAPIIFSSENDREFHPTSTLEPAPYDWSGITVHPDSRGTEFRHCVVRYSLFGIQSLAPITIAHCSFFQNGRSNIVIGTAGIDQLLDLQASSLKRDPPLSPSEKTDISGNSILRHTGSAIFVIGGIVGLAGSISYRRDHERWERLHTSGFDILPEQRKSLQKRVDQSRATAATGLLSAFVGGVVIGLSYSF